MKTQAEMFASDRVAEFRFFLEELRQGCKGKCSPSEWDSILLRIKMEVEKTQKKAHLNDE